MMVSITVDDSGWEAVPALADMTRAVLTAAAQAAGVGGDAVEVAVLFTGDDDIARLNGHWRGKPSPTNVLAFPAGDFPLPEGAARPLGDIVLAAGVVAREAAEQGKILPHHASHLIIHGFLHLLGYDHQNDGEAAKMESLEVSILKGLGLPDPYDRQ